tara:strand:+ start:2671 stop:2826 length:156 start_codon:yes stop_codon:yes gene_type:complete
MVVIKKLRKNEWSLDRKQAEIEKKGIVVPENLKPNSEQKIEFIESKFGEVK